MNKIFLAIICIVLASCCTKRSGSIGVITPIIDVPFGFSSKAVVKIVKLGNDYYGQNMSKEKFMIEILSLNHKKLDKVIVMHPIVADEKKGDYVIGSIYEVDCYEALNSNNSPRGWNKEIEQVNYMIERFLVIKKIAQQVNAPAPPSAAR